MATSQDIISSPIPTINLSHYLDAENESSRKMVIDNIYEAFTSLGIFQIENHGVAFEECEKLLKLTQEFFTLSDEVKKESTLVDKKLAGSGYSKLSHDKYYDFEYLLMYTPGKQYIGVPTTPDDYRKTYIDVFKHFVKTSQILEEIINDGLGLPDNFLKDYNNDRCWDFMFPMHYTPSNETKKVGIVQHQDPNIFTIILQDDTCGLEFLKDGEWIRLYPTRGKLIVIAGDLLQVMSNKKIRTVTHRAVKNKESKRLAIDFVYNIGPKKKVKPFHEHSKKLGADAMYTEFCHEEYADCVYKRNYKNPPSSVEEFVDLKRYEKLN